AQAGRASGAAARTTRSRSVREFGEGLPPGVVDDWRSGPLAAAGSDAVATAERVAMVTAPVAGGRSRGTPPKSGRAATDPEATRNDPVSAAPPAESYRPGASPSGPSGSPQADSSQSGGPGSSASDTNPANGSQASATQPGAPQGGDPQGGGSQSGASSSAGPSDPAAPVTDVAAVDPNGVDFNRPTARPRATPPGQGGNGGDEDDEPAVEPGPIADDMLSPSGDGMGTAPVGNAPGSREQRDPDGKP